MKLKKREINLDNSYSKKSRKSGSSSGSACGGGNVLNSNNLLSTKNDEIFSIPENVNVYKNENAKRIIETIPTDVSESDSSDSDENKIPHISTVECTSLHEGRQLVHTILPIKIDDLFNLLFTKSKFLLKFHEIRKSTDINFDNDWIINEKENIRTRIVTITAAIGAAIGPKFSKVTEYQKMRSCSKEGELYSIDIDNENAGIPYADSFSVFIHYCLVKSMQNHTMLSVHVQIKYKKPVWGVIKGFIERNTWSELKDYFSALLNALQNEICIPPAKGKVRRTKRAPPATQTSFSSSPYRTKNIENSLNNHNSNVNIAQEKITFKQNNLIKFFVLILLFILIVLNVKILFKLWELEERIGIDDDEDFSYNKFTRDIKISSIINPQKLNIINNLKENEMQYKTKLKTLQSKLHSVVDMLEKNEKSLQTICDSMPRIQQ